MVLTFTSQLVLFTTFFDLKIQDGFFKSFASVTTWKIIFICFLECKVSVFCSKTYEGACGILLFSVPYQSGK